MQVAFRSSYRGPDCPQAHNSHMRRLELCGFDSATDVRSRIAEPASAPVHSRRDGSLTSRSAQRIRPRKEIPTTVSI